MSGAQEVDRKPDQNQQPEPGTNLVVLEGEISSEPMIKDLPSGDILLAFDVRVHSVDGPAQSLPVTWIGSDPDRRKGGLRRLEQGKRCVVLGAMNRRFYQARSGAGLQSRVDVRAKKVVVDGPAKRRAAVARFLKGVS